MPMQSQLQSRAMHAAAEGNSTLGIPKSVGQDFVNASHGQSVSSLPKRASSSLEAATGMKSGTRRGRHAKQANKAKMGGHQALHAAMNKAYASGDFNLAKTHALNFANALHTAGNQATTSAASNVAGNVASQAQDSFGGSAPTGKQDAPSAEGYTPDPPIAGSSHWIQGAIKHPGALHRELGVPQGKTIPAAKVAKAAHSSNPTLARRARLAETLKHMHRK